MPEVLVNLGAVQATLGDSLGALATLERAVKATPDEVDAMYNLGLIQWRLGRPEAARATWARLLALAPESDLARKVRDLEAGKAE